MGHADAGFTLKVYARDGRDEAVVSDLLGRAATAGIEADFLTILTTLLASVIVRTRLMRKAPIYGAFLCGR